MDTAIKPVVNLGNDGNAFAILGNCTEVARKAGWNRAKMESFRTEAMSGDYDNLLRVVSKYFDVL